MIKTTLRFASLAAVFVLVACTQPTRTLVPLGPSVLTSPPQTVALQIQNYKPQTGNTFQNVFVSNFSVVAKGGNISYSTARDGLTDVIKQQQAINYGFNVSSPESVISGFSDLVLFISGVTAALQTNVVCPSGLMADTANDGFSFNDNRIGGLLTFLGLRDCDKTYLGINLKTYDSNNNGIPDYLELRCGMNPLSPSQAFISSAGDGIKNIDKCRMNLPIVENGNSPSSQLLAYQYSNTINSNGSLNLNIKNIPILNGGQDNFIAVYITELNSTTSVPSLYSAFLILPNGKAGTLLQFNYWTTSAANALNQQIIVP